MKFRFGRFEICRNMSLKHGPEDMGRKAVWINFRILVILEIVRVSADYHVPAGFLVPADLQSVGIYQPDYKSG